MKYRMVSLDTSSTKTGWAYWEAGELTEYGEIDHSKEKDIEVRFEDMCLSILSLLNRLKPETIVIEMESVTRNAHTQRILTEIIGVVHGWALSNYAEYVEYRPLAWRKLNCEEEEKVPAKREDAKAWSITKIKNLFEKDTTDNEADAILIGRARIKEFECK